MVDYAVHPDQRDCLLDLSSQETSHQQILPITIFEPWISVMHIEELSMLVSLKDTWASVSCGTKSAVSSLTCNHLNPASPQACGLFTMFAHDLNMTGETKIFTQRNIMGSLYLTSSKLLMVAVKELNMRPYPCHLNGIQAFIRNYQAIMQKDHYQNTS